MLFRILRHLISAKTTIFVLLGTLSFISSNAQNLVVDILAPGTVCLDDPFQIEGSVTGGTAPYDIVWNPDFGPGLGPFDLSITEDLLYSLTVTDADGNTSTVEGIVVVEGQLDVEITGNLDLCDGPTTLTAVSADATSFLWSTGATTASIEVATEGTYSVTVTSACGSVSDNVVVAACPGELTVEVFGATDICVGFSLSIGAEITGGVPPYTIEWNQGLGNAESISISPIVTTTYTVTVTDAAGNTATGSLTVTVVEGAELSLELGPDITFCADDPQTIGAEVPGAIAFIWSNGAGTPFIEPSVSGIYTLAASDFCSTVSDDIQVTVLEPNSTSFRKEFRLCLGDTLRIGPPERDDYSLLWDTGENTSQISVVESDNYGGSITDLCGTYRFSVNVDFVDCTCDIYIPNAFTPNSDGINDLFGIQTLCELRNYQLSIYDRWGMEVFSTNDPDLNWNGSMLGGDYFCKAGIYTYSLSAEQDTDLFAPQPIQLRGSVTLLR
jgi:gliding motility-associated-like protein